MKKMITLLTTICLMIFCAVPVLAAQSGGSRAGSPIFYVIGVALLIGAVVIYYKRKK